MLITVCDVPEKRRSDIEKLGGEVVQKWNGLMDAQFKNNSVIGNIIGEVHIYQVSTFEHICFSTDEYSRVYIQ